MPYSIDDINQMSQDAFTASLGFIFEGTPAIATSAWKQRPFANRAALYQAMMDAMNELEPSEQQALLAAHPELGSRRPMAVTSVLEQAGAGLNQLSPEEDDQWRSLNQRYRDKFGFPFIIAVRNHTPASILAALNQRLQHEEPVERQQALAQVAEIARLRLFDTVLDASPDPSASLTVAAPCLSGIRGAFLDLVADPFYQPERDCVRYIPDGLLILKEGHIHAFGPYGELQAEYSTLPITTYPDHLILPGLIDTHIHFPQTEMIASYGEQLLGWLNTYTFPTERKFKEKAYAQKVAALFLDELLKNGTTTALVFTAVYPESVDAFFEEAERRHLRMIAGKVMMDRNAPEYLMDTAASAYEDSKRLIQRWHRKGRLLYAVTPRFAATSTPAQLQAAARLLQEFPDVYLHTHLSENVKEVAWIQELFPQSQGYVDVYDQAGLVGDRSIFAHGVQLTDAEFKRLSEAQAAIAFCPTSNLFLGSGLFKLEKAKSPETPIKVGLGTDVGAGTSFSLLQTANEAYKVAQLRQQNLSPFKALFLATLGGARALNLDTCIGNFDLGKEADFIVTDLRATPLMAFRNANSLATSLADLAHTLFSLLMMGDDRAIHATYILGKPVGHTLI